MTHAATASCARGWRWVTWRDGLCLGVLVVLLGSTHWGTLNLSASVPVGLYRYVVMDRPVQRGDIIRIPAVPFGHGWPFTWLPLLKPIAGIAGDEVCVQPAGVWVEGVAYGPVYPQWRGQALPVFWGCHLVKHGEVFVASQTPKSLDSRYFGPVALTQARRVVPLWTWR